MGGNLDETAPGTEASSPGATSAEAVASPDPASPRVASLDAQGNPSVGAADSAADAPATDARDMEAAAQDGMKVEGGIVFDIDRPPSETGVMTSDGAGEHHVHAFDENHRARITTRTGEYMQEVCRCGATRLGRQVTQLGF